MISLVVPRRTKGQSPPAVDRKLLFAQPRLELKCPGLTPRPGVYVEKILAGERRSTNHGSAGVPTRPRLTIKLGFTQLVDKCTESRPIAPEFGQNGTCAARPISSIFSTKTVQLRNS